MSSQSRPYDVALSFAGEDRAYVEQVASMLRQHGVRVFYDRFETAGLWGKDLYVHLRDVYQNQAKFMVMFISKHYASKRWTNHERQSGQARAFSEDGEYILPARFDDSEVPGLPPTIGYIDLRAMSASEFVEIVTRKLDSIRGSADKWSLPQQVFIMHAATRGSRNLEYSVTRRRNRREIARALPKDSMEYEYFLEDVALDNAFPSGYFNCWGVPLGALPSFRRTNVGDLILFVGSLGEGAAIRQIGIVKVKCPIQCPLASKILWPEAAEGKTYPLLFFFDTEVGYHDWEAFTREIGRPGYNPMGWYKQIGNEFFEDLGGPAGYLQKLREKYGFAPLPETRPTVD